MILEILVSSTPTDKTFFYKECSCKTDQAVVGQLVKVKFRNKSQVGLILRKHKNLELKFKLLKVSYLSEDIIFTEEIINSMTFLSNYSCIPLSLIFKQFMSGYIANVGAFDENFKIFNKPSAKLNNEQSRALKEIKNINLEGFKVINFHGVTGSGKTRVYMKIVQKKLETGMQCLILVPEIILTKDWVTEIRNDFGISPQIFRSSESKKKRAKIWKSVVSGETVLIVGTRSALFLPFKNLGLIVVDEEQDQSYKQEDKIIFNTRDFAIVRAKNSSCQILLCSATPSLETNYNSLINRFHKVSLTKRINAIPLPEIKVVDMRGQKKIISDEIEKSIEENLKQNVQTIIYINKRGYTSFVICGKCGFVKYCKSCSATMVLHNFKKKSSAYFLCHQCSLKEKFSNYCENCNNNNFLRFSGTGVEKVEEEIKKKFPKIKTAILSSDFLKKTGNYEKILKEISTEKVDLIIGTQLISKGHNFPNIKTVGILNIDYLLNDFDFRSNEKAFQQIMQVSGRAGRKKIRGNVIIQTYQPQHPVIKFCKDYKIEEFYNWEINLRKKTNQPPFSNFISIITSSKSKQNASKEIEKIKFDLKKNFNQLVIYGPAPSLIEKKNNLYRFRLLLKLLKNYKSQAQVKKFLKSLLSTNKTRVFIDVDPINFL